MERGNEEPPFLGVKTESLQWQRQTNPDVIWINNGIIKGVIRIQSNGDCDGDDDWWWLMMIDDDWWWLMMMNDEWWIMNDEWWTMNDELGMMNDELWMMNDERLMIN